MFNRYYQDEVLYLRELGAEFARAHPTAAHFLASPGSDPDVERLLEGFAFLERACVRSLTTRCRRSRTASSRCSGRTTCAPCPRCRCWEFQLVFAALRQSQSVARGISVQSVPGGGHALSLSHRVSRDVELGLARHRAGRDDGDGGGRLWLGLKLWNNLTPDALDMKRLRIYLHGDPTLTYALYYLRCRLAEAWVGVDGPNERGAGTARRPIAVEPVGFSEEEAILTYPARSFSGYRLPGVLLAEKFLFLDLVGTSEPRGVSGERLWIELRFDRPCPRRDPLSDHRGHSPLLHAHRGISSCTSPTRCGWSTTR
ncbi:MAG: type VI secretion system baseplate subunit TssF [Candidatus Eisenbacteria bacterium]